MIGATAWLGACVMCLLVGLVVGWVGGALWCVGDSRLRTRVPSPDEPTMHRGHSWPPPPPMPASGDPENVAQSLGTASHGPTPDEVSVEPPRAHLIFSWCASCGAPNPIPVDFDGRITADRDASLFCAICGELYETTTEKDQGRTG